MESYLSRHNFIATSFRDRLSIDARNLVSQIR